MFDTKSFNAQLRNLRTALKDTVTSVIETEERLTKSSKSAANPLKEYESLTAEIVKVRNSIKDSISPIKDMRRSLRARQTELDKQIDQLTDPKGPFSATSIRNRMSQLMGDIANLQTSKLKADHKKAGELGQELSKISQKDYVSSQLDELQKEFDGNTGALKEMESEYKVYLKQLKTLNMLDRESIKLDKDREVVDNRMKGRREALSKIFGKEAEEVIEKLESLANSVFSVRGVMIGLAAAAMVGVEKFTHMFNHLREESGASVGQTVEMIGESIGGSLRNLIKGNLVGTGSSVAAHSGLVDELGTTHIAGGLVDTASKLTSLYGLSGAESGELVGNMSHILDNNVEMTDEMMNYTKQLGIANDIPLLKMYKGLTHEADLLARYGENNVKNLIKATAQANKFAIGIGKINQVADSLLDFDSSIDAEMQASALIGRGFDFSKARVAALNNDLSTVQNEIRGQLKGMDFAKLNRLQQNAIAKAVGMSNEDIMKMMRGHGEFREGDKSMGEDSLADKSGPLIDSVGSLIAKMSTLITVLTFTTAGSMLGKFGGALDAFKGAGALGLGRHILGMGAKITTPAVEAAGSAAVLGAEGAMATGAGFLGRFGAKRIAGGVPVIGGLITAGMHLVSGDTLGHSAGAGGASVAGGLIGGGLGLLGGPVGAALGASLGSWAGEALFDKFTEKTDPEQKYEKEETKDINTPATNSGVEKRLDYLTDLLVAGKVIAIANIDGVKVNRVLEAARPKNSAGPKG
jgi:hypothetical protein